MNKSDYKLIHLLYKNRFKNTKGRERRMNPRKIEAIASWKSCQSPPWSLESASKGPISLSPKLGLVLGCPFPFPLLGFFGFFGLGSSWMRKNEGCIRKTCFMLCLRVLAPQALARRWLGAVQALAPVFWRLQALARRWAGAGQTSFGKTAIATSSTVGLS